MTQKILNADQHDELVRSIFLNVFSNHDYLNRHNQRSIEQIFLTIVAWEREHLCKFEYLPHFINCIVQGSLIDLKHLEELLDGSSGIEHYKISGLFEAVEGLSKGESEFDPANFESRQRELIACPALYSITQRRREIERLISEQAKLVSKSDLKSQIEFGKLFLRFRAFFFADMERIVEGHLEGSVFKDFLRHQYSWEISMKSQEMIFQIALANYLRKEISLEDFLQAVVVFCLAMAISTNGGARQFEEMAHQMISTF